MFEFWRTYRLKRHLKASSYRSRRRDPFTRLYTAWQRLLSWPGRAVTTASSHALRRFDRLSSESRRTRDLCIGIPAILAFVGVTTVTALGHAKQSGAARNHWLQGTRLLQQGKSAEAKMLLQRAATGTGVNRREVLFALGQAYDETDDAATALALMKSLAPSDEIGFPPAHRYLAIRKAAMVTNHNEIDNIEEWHWHLSHADQTSDPTFQKSWGLYYLVGGDLEKAVQHLRVAALEEPQIWLKIAEIEAKRGDQEAVRRTLITARDALERRFVSNPDIAENRLLYATSLFYIGQLPDAERLLKQGLQAEDNQSFRQLLAAIFTRMHDAEVTENGTSEKAFQFLDTAIAYDGNYVPALTRVVSFATASDARLDQSRELMRTLIADGNASAMSHFALGSLEWIAGNQELAKLNMRQALAIDGSMAVIANNLAFLMAEDENGDLGAALEMVNQALQAEPESAEFLDTRGAIHQKMGNLAEAAVDYERALQKSNAPSSIQEKLAEVYERMGDKATAKRFREAALGPSL